MNNTQRTEQEVRMKKNMIITPKPSKKTGFTGWKPTDSSLIKDHVAEFLARGGEIDVHHTELLGAIKAKTGYQSRLPI